MVGDGVKVQLKSPDLGHWGRARSNCRKGVPSPVTTFPSWARSMRDPRVTLCTLLGREMTSGNNCEGSWAGPGARTVMGGFLLLWLFTFTSPLGVPCWLRVDARRRSLLPNHYPWPSLAYAWSRARAALGLSPCLYQLVTVAMADRSPLPVPASCPAPLPPPPTNAPSVSCWSGGSSCKETLHRVTSIGSKRAGATTPCKICSWMVMIVFEGKMYLYLIYFALFCNSGSSLDLIESQSYLIHKLKSIFLIVNE